MGFRRRGYIVMRFFIGWSRGRLVGGRGGEVELVGLFSGSVRVVGLGA